MRRHWKSDDYLKALRERHMYEPLRRFVRDRCGPRLAMHGGLRDQIVEWAVADFPVEADDDEKTEILRSRLHARAKEKYGSIIAMLIIGVLVNLITKAIMEWWKKHHSHQVLMAGWHAETNTDLPPRRPETPG